MMTPMAAVTLSTADVCTSVLLSFRLERRAAASPLNLYAIVECVNKVFIFIAIGFLVIVALVAFKSSRIGKM